MENWLNINQFRVFEWGLNQNEEKLCAYYSKPHSWVTNRISHDDGDYLCIAITKLIQELPTIGSTKPNFSRALNSLAEKQVFDKHINPNNKKEIYYRFNPVFLKAWKDNTKKIGSCIFEKRLILILNEYYYQNEIGVTEMKPSVTEMKPSVTEMKPSVTEMKPISINNQLNNQLNNNHNKGDDSLKAVTKMKQENLKKEFERILNIYPSTVNNTNEKIAEAFGVFCTFSQTQRVDVFKAVNNYAKTEQVKNQTASKFIQSIHTFLTKSYTKFIYELPKNYTFSKKFEQKNFEMGVAEDSAIVVYAQDDIEKICDYSKKFEEIKGVFKDSNIAKIDDKYDDSWVRNKFNDKEIEVIFVKMGGLNNVINFSSNQLAESLVDILKVENE